MILPNQKESKMNFQTSQLDAMAKTISKFATRAGFTGQVNRDNVQEIIKTLAEFHIESFADQLERGYDFAVRQYEFYTSPETKHFEENYHLITDNLDNILKVLDIQTDYPGLYPTFELVRNGKKFCEYSALGALRQYNNFWSHW
jgi:hypothetical protein